MGQIEGLIFIILRGTRGGGSIRGVFHFLHFVTLPQAQGRLFNQRERLRGAFVVARAQGIDGQAPVDGFGARQDRG